jgi:DNA-binding MarR family transcriptional regulator
VDGIGVFLAMISAYKLELGDAFPSADPRSVLLVLRECNKPEPTSQRLIELATLISQPNVAKLVAKMVDRGWLEASKRDPKTGSKTVQISLAGQTVLRDFERACKKAAMGVPKTATPKTQRSSNQLARMERKQ